MSYRQYLDHAKAAYVYVKQTMKIGAGNRVVNQPGGPLGIFSRRSSVAEMRKQTSKIEQDLDKKNLEKMEKYAERVWGRNANGTFKTSQDTLDLYKHVQMMGLWGELLEYNAAYAKTYGCGNCEEQSSLVFKFLKDRDVKPIDWMKQSGFFGAGLGNHAFVIVGRDKKTDASKISTWNPEVVYCDPYEDELGGMDLIQKRFGGEEISLLYRWDDFPKPVGNVR